MAGRDARAPGDIHPPRPRTRLSRHASERSASVSDAPGREFDVPYTYSCIQSPYGTIRDRTGRSGKRIGRSIYVIVHSMSVRNGPYTYPYIQCPYGTIRTRNRAFRGRTRRSEDVIERSGGILTRSGHIFIQSEAVSGRSGTYSWVPEAYGAVFGGTEPFSAGRNVSRRGACESTPPAGIPDPFNSRGCCVRARGS